MLIFINTIVRRKMHTKNSLSRQEDCRELQFPLKKLQRGRIILIF